MAMTLKELIERLEKEDANLIVPNGFNHPHSYRGYYVCLAFEPAENTSVGDMLDCAKKANGRIYLGWKGGDFKMDEDTDVYLAEEGHCGDELSARLLEYMLSEAKREGGE